MGEQSHNSFSCIFMLRMQAGQSTFKNELETYCLNSSALHLGEKRYIITYDLFYTKKSCISAFLPNNIFNSL